MRASGAGGSIIATASIAGLLGGTLSIAYAAAKAGVIQLAKRSAAQLAPARVRVNTIAPGFIFTPMVHRGLGETMRPFCDQAQPWPRAGEPEDVAQAAVFLASDESRFITGTTITVDGGVTAVGSDRFNAAFADSPLSSAGRHTAEAETGEAFPGPAPKPRSDTAR
jgi:NAD(P)-dependent dehydrogenase (short-subunit alcohol dehydrogenase family)